MSQPAKVLLLYAHPESQDSVANRVLLKPATQLSNVTVHDLYAHYPDFFIDIPREQALLREHEVIVFQHPLYTYSCPALLKEWLDRVLSRGFASGPGGNQLAGKYWRSVITTGEPESAYRYDALNRYPMSDVLRPFELPSLFTGRDGKAHRSWRVTPEPTVTGWQIRCLQEAADGRFRFFTRRSAVSLRGGGCGAVGIAAGDWRCVGIFAGRDCNWPVGAGVY